MHRMIRALSLTALLLGATAAWAQDETPEAAALGVLDAFMTAFNARDLEAWEATYHFPHFRMADGRLTVLEAAGQRSETLFDALAATGWHHSAWLSREAVQAGDDKVHVAVEFARYRADGSELARYQSLYVVTRGERPLGHPRPFELRAVSGPDAVDRTGAPRRDPTVTARMQTLPKQRQAQHRVADLMRDRVKQRWPMVLLTLVSIIQALALETLWSEIVEESAVFVAGVPGAIAALQTVIVLFAIVLVWVFFAQLVMRFIWFPGMRDSLAPFAIGLIEFVLAELVGAGQYGIWIALLAFAFLAAHLVLISAFARAAREPENGGFFVAVQARPVWQRHGPTLGFTALLLLVAGVVELAASELVTLVALCVVLTLLLVQLWLQRVYWYSTVR